jgi:ribulose-phosphate 3-epimerase
MNAVVPPPTSPDRPRPIEIVPSVLSADFARLGDEVQNLEKAGVDRIQWDVMDGHFVPNLTFGPDVIAACRPHVSVPFEAHLMVDEPDALLHRYVEAGCEVVIVHAEATRHLHRTLGLVRELGASAAVALNPATPADAVANVLDLCSMVLVMTVNPGFGGQKYIATMEPKIAAVRRMIVDGGHDCDLEVDGGIAPETVAGAAAAGANVLVAGSALFRDPAGLEHAVADLRERARPPQPAKESD